MGEANRRKALGIEAVPAPDQPIAPEQLKALYPELLELQLANAHHRLEAERIAVLQNTLAGKVQALAAGTDLAKWNVDLKTGRMVQLEGV